MFDTLTRMGASAAGAYEIERSLRFNDPDSTYLTKDFGTATNRKIWTWSCWFKRERVSDTECWFSALAEGSASWYSRFADNGDDNFEFTEYSGSSYVINLRPNMKLRDFSAWYHVVVAYDSTQGTAANRVKMYVNGTQITSFGTETYPSLNQESGINKNHAHTIGKTTEGSSYYYSGYMTDMYFVDGQQLTPSSFGETNADTGQWIPKKYGGTYGNNGFFLNFSDNSNTTASTLGDDDSANTNDWTPTNFSVAAGVGNDSFIDTPTNNFCTWNSGCGDSNVSSAGATALTEGGTYRSGGTKPGRGTMILKNNKYYFEVKINASSGSDGIGVGPQYDRDNTKCAHWFANGEYKIEGASQTTGFASYTTNDIIGIAIDTTQSPAKIWFAKNNTWQNSGNPSTGANGMSLTVGEDYVFSHDHTSGANSSSGWALFGGNGYQAYTPPTDFVSACTANLPTPTIKKGSDYFNTVLYTGNNNSNQTISGVGFQPDLVWVKNRDNVERHHLIDAVRGNNKVLFSNEPDAERTGSHGAGHTQLNLASDGFNLVSNGSNDELNFGTRTYVAWNWKESATAGFDIVGFNPSSGTNTYNHSLGVKPDAIFIKSRGSSANWDVYHSKLTAENKLYLNASDAQIDSGFMGDTEPTSSVFSYNPGSQNGNNHIAYLFSNVEGYSKVGKYTGNGDANGSFIYTGFKPVWIIYKKVAAENWHMLDIKRDAYNPNSAGLDPNLYNAEANDANLQMDFLSNGFKLRSSHGTANASGEPYIYMAFAETPFKYANAR